MVEEGEERREKREERREKREERRIAPPIMSNMIKIWLLQLNI